MKLWHGPDDGGRGGNGDDDGREVWGGEWFGSCFSWRILLWLLERERLGALPWLPAERSSAAGLAGLAPMAVAARRLPCVPSLVSGCRVPGFGCW